uniref:(California timema) hypothetical protein n=1 Tax=Timema californicum TaxID=61474 RepID=A0A7R9J807_TIMCA|nr:unnamed protein product [Timema californicum]
MNKPLSCECLDYRPAEMCVYFDGSLESTVTLHLYYALLSKLSWSTKIQAMNVTDTKPSQQFETYIQETCDRYNLDICTFHCPVEEGITALVTKNQTIKVIIQGHRSSNQKQKEVLVVVLAEELHESTTEPSPSRASCEPGFDRCGIAQFAAMLSFAIHDINEGLVKAMKARNASLEAKMEANNKSLTAEINRTLRVDRKALEARGLEYIVEGRLPNLSGKFTEILIFHMRQVVDVLIGQSFSTAEQIAASIPYSSPSLHPLLLPYLLIAPLSSAQSPTPSLDLHNFYSPSCTLISFKPYDFLYPS